MNRIQLRKDIIKLRKFGKTYKEIQILSKTVISKSTISNWCSNIPLPTRYKSKIEEYNRNNLKKARIIALEVNRKKRKAYYDSLIKQNQNLLKVIKNRNCSLIALSMLYLGEGSKTRRGSLMFGNSDPLIVNLFLRLLRRCYQIDEKKFRCTLQGRADQNIKELESYWSKITKIPLNQFYQARIDARTIGKISKKPNYKGVCRIDYFCADIYNELMVITQLICENY